MSVVNTPSGLDLAARHLLWSLPGKPIRRLRRKIFLPPSEEMLAQFDNQALREVRERYAPGLSDEDLVNTRRPVKYVDALLQVKRNLRRADELDLCGRPPIRILDIGCGSGFFLRVCEALGHSAIGFDLDENPLYTDLIAALGVRRIVGRIDGLRPMPCQEGPFDLITAFAVCFNDHHTPKPWGPREWEFFLDDVAARLLAPQGELAIKLNPWGTATDEAAFYTPELKRLFLDKGAKIDGPSVRLSREGIRRKR